MHRARLTLIGAALLGLAAMQLPHFEASRLGSLNGWAADAWPLAALVAAPAVLALLGDRREGFHIPLVVLSLAAAGTATVFAVAKIIDASEAARSLRDLGTDASIGSGAWLALIAALVSLAGSVLSASRTVR